MSRKKYKRLNDDNRTSTSLTRKQVLDRLRRGESLTHQDMRGLDLYGICFDDTDLSYAKMADANLAKATFRRANLTGASLWHADLRDTLFEEANLEDTDFDMALLDGARFKAARLRRTLFPFERLPLEDVKESVRTGRRVFMDSSVTDDL